MRTLSALLALACVAGCPTVDSDDPIDVMLDPSYSALVLHGPFDGDATLRATDSAGIPYEGLDPLGLPGTDWALGGGVDDFWLIGRLGTDVVRRYDFPDLSAPLMEVSTGSPSNPQVAQVCAGAVFVSRYGLASGGGGGDVAAYELGGAALGAIDLSAFAEGTDGTPEPSTMAVVGDTLYVGLQRFDRDAGWVADPVGKVVAIDCVTREVAGSWDVRSNPSVFTWGGDVYVRGEGGLQRLDAGAVVDVALDEDFGGDVVLGVAAGQDAWTVVTEADDGLNSVHCFLPGEEPELLETSTHRGWDIALAPDGSGWVAWRDHWLTSEVEEGAIRAYDPVTCSVSLDWQTYGSYPISIAFSGTP